MVINPIEGVYMPIIGISYWALDDHPQYKEFRPYYNMIPSFSLGASFEFPDPQGILP